MEGKSTRSKTKNNIFSGDTPEMRHFSMNAEVIKGTYKEYSPDTLDREETNNLIHEYFNETQFSATETEQLMIECSSSIANGRAMSSELKEQGLLKRVWGGITGKNRQMRDAINDNVNDALYAQQQILLELSKRQASEMAIIASINHEMHTLYIEINEELAKDKLNIRLLCDEVSQRVSSLERDNEKNINRINQLYEYAVHCPDCDVKISSESVICPYCGHLFAGTQKEFKKDSILVYYRNELKKLIEIVRRNRMNKNQVKDKQEEYLARALDLKKYTDELGIGQHARNKVEQICDEFEKQVKNSTVEIAIVGTVKAGKSMLINALLDCSIAPVDANPETSCLTIFRSGKNKKCFFSIKFYTMEEWNELWNELNVLNNISQVDKTENSRFIAKFKELKAEDYIEKWVGQKDYQKTFDSVEEMRDELSEFIGSTSPIHFFVKEADVVTNTISLPGDVCLVDTPGLHDVEIRSKVTEKYLHTADAVLACTKASELSDTRFVKFVQEVLSKHKDVRTVCIVATQMDAGLTETEYESKKSDFIANKMTPLFDSHKNEKSRINYRTLFFGVTAKMYVLSKEYEDNLIVDSKERMNDFMAMMFHFGFGFKEDYSDFLSEIRNKSGIIELRNSVTKSIVGKARIEHTNKLEDNYNELVARINNLSNHEINKIDDIVESLESDEQDYADKLEQYTLARENLVTILEAITMIKARKGK